MKHILIRVAQRLLALSLLSASLAVAETAPDLTAAREAAAQVMPKLRSGSWQTYEVASQTINQLASSQEKADKELAEKLVGLCANAIELAIQNLPEPPEQERLFRDAEDLVNALLHEPTTANRPHAVAIISLWENAQPGNLHVRLLRLKLLVADNNREGQIKLAAALADEKDLDQSNLEYVWDVQVSALLRKKPSADDIQRAEAVLTPWLKQKPKNLRPRQLLLQIHQARKDYAAQYALATELLADENLTGSDLKWVQHCRVDGAIKTGRTHELNEQDWNFMLERITGGKKLKAFIDKHGQLLLGIAFGIGWLWLFIVAFITRCVRATSPPRFWMVVLWMTTVLYASTVIMAPLALCIAFSSLGIVFLIFGITGGRAPLGYLVPPQADSGLGRARWRGILGWCVLAFVIIQVFTQGYAWVFERVMGRALESQFVAKLLQTDTLPRLVGMVLAGGIFVPFLEEVVFRGMLQDWVGKRLSAGWCVLVVSILFGVIHGLEMAIPIAFIGMLLSFLRLRYRSLWPCIVLHSLNNSVMIILLHFIPEKVL